MVDSTPVELRLAPENRQALLVCTLHGLPVGWALTGAKADEREVLEAILASTPELTRPGRQVVISDKGSSTSSVTAADHGRVCTRIAQRVLALTAVIWHNDNLGLTVRRSPTAYDH